MNQPAFSTLIISLQIYLITQYFPPNTHTKNQISEKHLTHQHHPRNQTQTQPPTSLSYLPPMNTQPHPNRSSTSKLKIVSLSSLPPPYSSTLSKTKTTLGLPRSIHNWFSRSRIRISWLGMSLGKGRLSSLCLLWTLDNYAESLDRTEGSSNPTIFTTGLHSDCLAKRPRIKIAQSTASHVAPKTSPRTL